MIEFGSGRGSARNAIGLAAALTAAVMAPGAIAQDAGGTFKASCDAFRPDSSTEGEAFVSAQYQTASAARPAFCLVRGKIATSPRSEINYRVDLPDTTAWNGKLAVIGGGGTDGVVTLDPIMGVERYDLWPRIVGYQGTNLGAYILVGTDSGHQGRGLYPSFEMSWAAGNPDAVVNYAYRANHLVLWAAVARAKQFYGREPSRRYIFGGSNGGRQGIVAAQRYPDDYHGVFAFAPALDIPGWTANQIPTLRHIFKRPENWLGPDALDLFTKAEVAACDGLDGLKDGIISNYRACKFDGSPLLCPEGERAAKPAACLTAGQVETIRLVRGDKRSDIVRKNGWTGYPGFGPGAPASAWQAFLSGSSFEARDAFSYLIASQMAKYLTDDPNADVMSFDPAASREALAKFSDLMDPEADLSPFFAKGGKVIIIQGVGDTIIAEGKTDDYVDLVNKTVGAPTVRKSLRYYVSPTLDHYMDGPEANVMPFLSMLENWVEKGTAPGPQIATRLDPAPGFPKFETTGKPSFTRPLCEYGSFPKYRGKGDSNKASSFTCTAN